MIKNISKKTIISPKVKLCKSFLSKSVGLMFQNIKPIALCFNADSKIKLHTFFCRSMDIILVNNNLQVVELKENLRPFSFFNPDSKASFVLELPTDSIKISKTRLNDKIIIEKQ